ncbi:hypothetical protein [Streptomyces sp. MST-110588]|uniref:hypothetical protein n=1 Tax=Streptomyces sp. MST-110588 TaxID=2833628 RepID=UPI001F5CA3C9|nr:hypothetical protein [Streptomyces sp. MST-110588]UNO39649.1 hypothetical protein KGS77_08600 [Streptomyces sp. MST-110588]
MGSGFQTDPEAILGYAMAAERQHEEIPRIGLALAHVDVPSGAFGHLPDSDELHSAYNEHAEAAQQNIKDLAELVQTAAESLREAAGNYFANEYALQAGFGGGNGGSGGSGGGVQA